MTSFDIARNKGFKAGFEGKPKSSCPYEDIRTGIYDHVTTWSRGYINAWEAGWEEGKKEKEEKEKQKDE